MAIISIPTSVSGIGVPGTVGKILKGPLAALYRGKGVDTVNYPHDLAKDPTQSHYVSFSVKQVIPAGFSSEPSNQQSIGLKTGGKAIETLGNYTKSLLPEGSSIGEGVASVTGFFGEAVAKGIAITPQTTQLQSIISLYMPDSLTAEYNAEYETLSLTQGLGSTITSLRAIDQMAGKVDTSSFSAGVKSLGNLASTDPGAIFAANELASKAGFGNEGLRDVMINARGYAINPQNQMIYRGIGFRSFQLEFTLSPRSKQEAGDIDRIISTFKWHFAPSLQSGNVSSGSMFLIQPSIFNIKFKLGGNENRYLPKYGDCVLKNISVNYAPNGWAAYEDGFPVQTHLSLQFEEMVILDKDKLQKGFDGSSDGLR
jgi:hypothetical protein